MNIAIFPPLKNLGEDPRSPKEAEGIWEEFEGYSPPKSEAITLRRKRYVIKYFCRR